MFWLNIAVSKTANSAAVPCRVNLTENDNGTPVNGATSPYHPPTNRPQAFCRLRLP